MVLYNACQSWNLVDISFEGIIYQGRDEDSDEKSDDVAPCRECDVLFDDNDETEDEAEYKDSNVPPPGSFLVVLGHMLVVSVVVSPVPRTFIGLLDITPPKQEAVSNQGTNLSLC